MFTKRVLEQLQATGKQYTVKDEKTPGLVLMVTPKGAKTFYWYKWLAGKPERIKLGTFPAMTIEQARAKAANVNGAVAKDHNPAEAKRAVKAEPTFAAVFELYLKRKRNRSGKPLADRSVTEYRLIFTNHLGDIASRKMSQITPEHIRAIVGKMQSAAQINKVKAIISAIYTWARDEGITDQPSPAQAIKNKVIPSRERFLLPSEFPKFMAAVEESSLRDFFLLCLFTGARRSNVQAMRWQDVNLQESTWVIPKTKSGHPQTVPLPPEAVEIIRSRKALAVVGATYIFPGVGKRGHLTEPKRAWTRILETAGISDLRIHDLRRTLGSWQARQGTSLAVIGKSLGHRSHQATQIYSRIDLDPVRASVEQATTAMIEASKQPAAEVVPIRRKAKET